MTPHESSGVWLSDTVLDENEGARGDVVLSIEIPEDAIKDYEWSSEENDSYREWLVPASVVNQYGPLVAVDEDDEALIRPYWREIINKAAGKKNE